MKWITFFFLFSIVLIGLAGCTTDQPVVEHEDHSSVAVTRWTDKSELFMEYDELIAGQASGQISSDWSLSLYFIILPLAVRG